MERNIDSERIDSTGLQLHEVEVCPLAGQTRRPLRRTMFGKMDLETGDSTEYGEHCMP